MTDIPQSFEESLAELEAIVQLLDRGEPTLDESLERFERGVTLLRHCRSKLQAAETQVRELVEIDDAGNVRLRPFEHEATIQKATQPEDCSEPEIQPRKRKRPPPAPAADPAEESEDSLF